MKFGVTAGMGLIAGILEPFTAFLRTPTLMAIGSALVVALLAFVYFTLTSMQNDTEIATYATQAASNAASEVARSSSYSSPAADVDPGPSMQQMLSEIYGQ